MKKNIVIVGPTASGKTGLAVFLARKFNGEIISADSRQVYKGMTIGSGKEYFADIKQHLIDIRQPAEEIFNVYDFQKLATEKIDEILAKNKIPIIVGGTGLYISSLVNGYKFDIKGKKSTEKNSPDYDFLILGTNINRQELYQRIDQRVNDRIKNGMIEEVEKLLENGVSAEKLIKFGLEYKFITEYLTGIISDKNEMIQKLKFATHAYARRQLTWLRHKLDNIIWIKNQTEAEKLAKEFLV